jgi:tRNA modification GTPase
MYNLSDTVVAVSSPPEGARTIVRITGPQTIKVCEQFSGGPISKMTNSIISGQITVNEELKIDAKIYIFFAPHSYTGDDVAEIHLHASRPITETLIGDLLSKGLKPAGPGEFTARAFLNGKIDLAQAEAVNEIITTSNKFQLTAAEKLLSGHLAKTTEKILSEVMDCLSLIEAGMDFSEEDIEFITIQEVIDRLLSIRKQLEQLLSGSIRYESIIDLPSVK